MPAAGVRRRDRMLGVSRSTIYKYVPELGTGQRQLTVGDDRPMPDVSKYDELLPSHRAAKA